MKSVLNSTSLEYYDIILLDAMNISTSGGNNASVTSMSDLVHVEISNEDDSNGTTTIRIGRVLSLLTKSTPTTAEFMAMLAVIDFNNRTSQYNPNLADEVGRDCNVYLTIDFASPYVDLIGLGREFQEEVIFAPDADRPRPMAVLGSVTSPESGYWREWGRSPRNKRQNCGVCTGDDIIEVRGSCPATAPQVLLAYLTETKRES